jgi:hypothetical protein
VAGLKPSNPALQASSCCLASEALRDRVREAIERHWARPQLGAPLDPVAPGQVEELSRRVLDTMLTRQFRVGPLPPAPVYEALLERVRRRVRRGEPVRVTVGYGPLKNQHAVGYSRADWAEFFALCHLVAWHNKVQAVYPPGLRIGIAFDDATLVVANRVDKRLMEPYIDSMGALICALGFDRVLTASLRHSCFAWAFHFGFYQVARIRVFLWERDPRHREQIERMYEYARRNLVIPPGLNAAQEKRYIRAASHRYRVYWDALQLSGLSTGKKRIVAMYLDGSQHHIRQAEAMHLTTLDKGQVTQPWQGAGALLDNGHGKLEPFVLTAGRQARYETRLVDGLEVLPLPGFDRIAIAWPRLLETEGPAVNGPAAVLDHSARLGSPQA